MCNKSPDLMSCGHAMWGACQKVLKESYHDTKQSKDAVRTAFTKITGAELRKISHVMWRCIILYYELIVCTLTFSRGNNRIV